MAFGGNAGHPFQIGFTKAGTPPALITPIVPTDLSGLVLWLKADALGLSDNDPISTWADSSGNGNDAIGVGGARPIFKTAILNGLPVVRFDGIDDFLKVTALAYGEFTILYVYKVTTGGIIGEHSVNASFNHGDYHYQPGGAHVAANGAGGLVFYDINSPSLAPGTFRVVTRTMDGTGVGHQAWVDGVLATRGGIEQLGNPGTGVVTDDYYIGARAGSSLFTDGDIPEIVIFDNVKSIPELRGLEAHEFDKYAL
jgi:hypothetical protein